MPTSTSCSYQTRWPELVSPYYRSLATSAPGDPIAAQFAYNPEEDRFDPTCQGDPFGECTRAAFFPGVKRRFPDRVLIMVSHACAVHCRHCTRKNLLGVENPVCTDLSGALKRIKECPEIREILLSGGDPLILEPGRIVPIVEACAALEQVDAVRIGTRVPVVDPDRIVPHLAAALGQSKKVWVNTQFNHPKEITPAAARACGRLVDAGIPVSNQSVLLRGINDSVETMVALCAGLQRIRVRPYYVFQCDPVQGTAHFRVEAARAREIAREVTRRLGGLAVPRFVIDRPGEACKTPLRMGIEAD